MFVGEEDRVARSVALEKTYVHDVYDQMSALQYPEQRNSPTWPKVKKFIKDLEPGSSVCDVGCGSGKYLEINSGIYKVGIDICKKLTQVAKDEDKEVILCDNLILPFRDESFDAVLSIAVIHHFATRERRVCALKELARILRVGGRLIITVWAMEQKHRKFETQDVLVPWHRPQYPQCSSLEVSTSATATSEEDFAAPIRVPVETDMEFFYPRSGSLQQEQKRGKARLQLFRSLRSIKTSPSSSTLSSPNETCYSFVRKALQKLSRSNKREKHESRTWFLDSWASISRDDHLPATRYDPEGCEEEYEDIQNLPIEIIRMEKELEPSQAEKASSAQHLLEVHLPQKSRSMNDIPHLDVAPIARSRSIVAVLDASNKIQPKQTLEPVVALKPRLIKQKKSLCEETDQEFQLQQEIGKKISQSDIPPAEISPGKLEKFNVLKQKSLTEEIMSADRLKEKEHMIQNIQKQASLNEELIYRRHKTSLDSLKDTLFSGSTAKRFQLFRSGLTSKIKSSTTNIEKVTSGSIKSGFVRIFQNLTGGDGASATQAQDTNTKGIRKSSSEDRGDDFFSERRCSHEENSDSSKDNSLQSDTSVDSEDSVISVIERVIIKPDQICSPTKCSTSTSPVPNSPKLLQHSLTGLLSHPSSPKIAQTSQYQNSKALSLPASPRNISMSPSVKQTFKIPLVSQSSLNNNSSNNNNNKVLTGKLSLNGTTSVREKPTAGISTSQYGEDEVALLKLSPKDASTNSKLKVFSDKDIKLLSHKLTLLSEEDNKMKTEPREDVCEGDESEKSDIEPDITLKKITESELSKESCKISNLPKSVYGLIKRSTAGPGTSVTHPVLVSSYDLFNPETEDIETDSSGVSSPDSVDSVISVKMDDSETPPPPLPMDRQDDGNEGAYTQTEIDTIKRSSPSPSLHAKPTVLLPCETSDLSDTSSKETHDTGESCTLLESSNATISKESTQTRKESSSRKSLSGGVQKVVTTLEQISEQIKDSKAVSKLTVFDATQSASKLDSQQIDKPTFLMSEPPETLLMKQYPSLSKLSPSDETWGNECRQYLVEFAENLSEKLLAEIDRYKEQNINIERTESVIPPEIENADPYLTKLSEELHHVSKLTKELSQDYDIKSAIKPTSCLEMREIRSGSFELMVKIKETGIVAEQKEERAVGTLISESSTEMDSPGSVSGWLDSRRNTIESTMPAAAVHLVEEKNLEGECRKSDIREIDIVRRRSSVSQLPEQVRKLSKTDSLQPKSSIESVDTGDVSEKTLSSEDSKHRPGTSSRHSLESDISVLDRSIDTSKSAEQKRELDERKYSGSLVSLRPGESIESSDTCDISDRTGSVSDFSRQNTESRSVITQSSASLASWSDCSKDIRFADRRMARCDGRSSSEETNPPRGAMLTRQKAATQEPLEIKEGSTDASLSESTSQDSLTSESGGGSFTFHRYYHVFKEGELDQLIDEYVENLHIISSYYDHSNWCVIAEKVQVWTI